MTTNPTNIRKGDKVTLPSGETVRVQRVSHTGDITEIIFPSPFDGRRWLLPTAQVTIER